MSASAVIAPRAPLPSTMSNLSCTQLHQEAELLQHTGKQGLARAYSSFSLCTLACSTFNECCAAYRTRRLQAFFCLLWMLQRLTTFTLSPIHALYGSSSNLLQTTSMSGTSRISIPDTATGCVRHSTNRCLACFVLLQWLDCFSNSCCCCEFHKLASQKCAWWTKQ